MNCCVEYAKDMYNVVHYWSRIYELVGEVRE